MRTKRKMTAVIICILFAVLFACYGFWMSGNGSGTGFFLIWFVLAALLGGCAAITFLDGWARLPMWMLWILRGILLVFVVSFVIIEGCIISQMHAKADENLDYIIVLGAQVRADGPSKATIPPKHTTRIIWRKIRRQSVLCQVDRGITSHVRKRRRWLIIWKRPELRKTV